MTRIILLFQKIIASILQRIIYYPTKILLKIFLKFEVRGNNILEKIKSNESIILVSNHCFMPEILAIPICLPFLSRFLPVFFVIRKLKEYPWLLVPLVLIFKPFGTIVGKKAYSHSYGSLNRSLKKVASFLKIKNSTLCIFPEGGIKAKNKKARPGVVYLIRESKSPVVLIKIDVEKRAFPKRTTLIVNFLKVMDIQEIFPLGYCDGLLLSTAQKLMDRINDSK